jgi:hypothetical protein
VEQFVIVSSADEKIVLRMRTRVLAAWIIGVLGAGTMIVQALLSSGGLVVASVIMAALIAVLCVRLGRARIECKEDGVLIVNTYYKRRLRWSDIDHFDFNLKGLNPWVAFAVLKTGKKVTIAAIQGPQLANSESRRLKKPREMVSQLNKMLESHCASA